MNHDIHFIIKSLVRYEINSHFVAMEVQLFMSLTILQLLIYRMKRKIVDFTFSTPELAYWFACDVCLKKLKRFAIECNIPLLKTAASLYFTSHYELHFEQRYTIARH